VRAARIVRNLLTPCLGFLHAARFRLLLLVVEAAFRSSRLTLTAIGRALPSGARVKHRIKAVDRFLANVGLQAARSQILQQLATTLVRGYPRPIIAVDWTQIVGDYDALWAGIVFRGRTVPLFAEVLLIRKRTKRKAHERFLIRLREILPRECRPILVLDAEFCIPFLEACTQVGCDFVVRLRGKCCLRPPVGAALLASELAKKAKARPQCCGESLVYDSARRGRTYRVVLAKKPRGRLTKKRATSLYRRRALTAWVLATNVVTVSAAQIVNIYAKRMQVEQMYRDAKDPRYGWALNLTTTRDVNRLSMLLLVSTLALLVAMLIGATAERNGLARSLQANTERRRRVLSLVSLGRILAVDRKTRLPVSQILLELRSISAEHRLSEREDSPRPMERYACSRCRRGWGAHR